MFETIKKNRQIKEKILKIVSKNIELPSLKELKREEDYWDERILNKITKQYEIL